MNRTRVPGDHSRLYRAAVIILMLEAFALPAIGDTGHSSADAVATRASADWPMFHAGPRRTGVNGVESQIDVATAPNLGVKWSFPTAGPIWSSPVVAGGVVYFGSDDKKVYAVDAETGALKWSYATGDLVRSPPAVRDGVVYVGSDDDKVYALRATDGAKIWSYATEDDVELSSPLVARGKVYVGSLDGNVYALDQRTGRLVWSVYTWAARGSFAIAGSTVFVGSDKSTLWAFDADTGTTRWTAAVGGRIRNTPAVSRGVVYVGVDDGRVYAFDAATGDLKWQTVVLSGCAIVRSTPAVYGGKIYVVTGETCPMTGHFYAFDAATGNEVCSHEMADYATSSVAIAGGVALVGSFSYQLYAFDASDCDKLWDSGFDLMQGGIPSSPAVARGSVYVGSLDSSLYAFTPTETPLSSFITIGDNFFDPDEVIGNDIGTGAQWTNDGQSDHDVTDSSGMDLFISGTIPPGDRYTFVFSAAGIYKYSCTIHPSMTGTIKAPMVLTPASGNLQTEFTIQWATEPPPTGFVYDVQIRRPGSSEFVNWKVGTTLASTTFVADAGKGDYDFKAHIEKVSNGKSATYSPFKTITVS